MSAHTDKSAKSKTESISNYEMDGIPHLQNMYEYLISQKGSRDMQLFIKKEANHD